MAGQPDAPELLQQVARLLKRARYAFLACGLAFVAWKAAEAARDGLHWQDLLELTLVSGVGPAVVWITAGWAERVARLAGQRHEETLALTRRLEEIERRYRLLAENLSDVVFTFDMDLRPTYVSPSVTRLRGYTVEEALRQPIEQWLTPASVERARQGLAQTLGSDLAPDAHLMLKAEVVRRDGTTVWTENTLTVRRDPEGRPVEIVGVARDITERRQAEASRREASELEAVAALANATAHEINNPLAVITGHLELMAPALQANARAATRLVKMRKSAERIRAIVERMRRITRLETMELAAGLPPALDLAMSSRVAPGAATMLTPALTEVLRRAARQLGRALGADQVGAYLADANGEALHAVAGYHVPKDQLDALLRVPIPARGHRMVLEGWETRMAVVSADVEADQRVDRRFLARFPVRSVIFVPLCDGATLIGGLVAAWVRDPAAFTEADLTFATLVGQRTAAEMTAAAGALVGDDGGASRAGTAETLDRNARQLLDAPALR
jgi:PAS domain S-box-containing protein